MGGAEPRVWENELLERERELTALQAALTAAAAGDGALVFVEAGPGIGKSRLLAAAADLASAQGFRVLRSQGSELEREHSMGVVLQLFGAVVAGAGPAERDDLLGGAANLARPLLEGNWEELGGSADEQVFALLHGLYWLTSNLSERGPLALIVDDAHWADRSSLRFLVYLAQRVRELPLAIVLSARPAEPGAHEELLRQLKGGPEGSTVRPAALSRQAAATLVEGRMPGAEQPFAEACAAVTDGNPYLLTELVSDLTDRQVAPTAGNAGAIGTLAPESVLDSALVRLTRLPDRSADLARAVAVLGDDARLGSAAELAGLDVAEARPPLDALVAADILSGGEPLRFVHPLLHSAIYADTPGFERAEMHQRAARLLESRGAPTASVAAHLMLAPATGDKQVVSSLRRAAVESLASGSPESASRYLERALEEPPLGESRPELLLELANADAAAGRGDAVDRMEQALALLEDPRRRAAALSDLGWMLQKRGDLPGAIGAFARGIEELAGSDSDEDLATGIEVANLQAAHLGAALLDPASAEEAHRRVAPLSTRPVEDLSGVERGLLTIPAMHLMFSGEDHEQVISLCDRAWGDGALIEQVGADSPTIWHVEGLLAWADDLDGAEKVIEAVLAKAYPDGSLVTQALALYGRSWPRYWRGDLAGAAADAQAAVNAWSGDFSMYLPVAAYWLALAQLELGDVDAAGAALDYPDAEERWGDTNMFGALATGQALVALARGDADVAVERAERAGKSVLGAVVTNPAVIPWRSVHALALAATGEIDGARTAAGEEVELARRFGARRPLGISLRAAGMVERGEAGIPLLVESVEVLRPSPAEFELARSLVELGAALRRSGRRAEAREPLQEGREMAQRFGAVVTERRAFDELEASGARPRRRELSGVHSLTPSERRVAELAASGMTNREIAQSLFVTVKAVQFHLTNVYRKLEVDGRDRLSGALGGSALAFLAALTLSLSTFGGELPAALV